ncbi:hypothetical protein GCM10025782_30260 [Pedococcus ginsenosidimutans]|uniref:Uncharacterized protein n=1 Tax=Pedococcus ginsenosidimutans TaxID=490570 RepID=A0ABP8YG74_9MICO
MLVQVGLHPGTGDGALVHADVVAHRLRGRVQRPDGLLREACELDGLLVGEVDVEGHVPVGADQDVTGVVREQVHDDVAVLTAVDHQPLGVASPRGRAERAAVSGVLARPLAGDVGHPVGGPEPLEPVRDAREVGVRLGCALHAPILCSTPAAGRADGAGRPDTMAQ